MFTYFSHCRFELHKINDNGSVSEFNIWDYVPHTMLSVDEKALGAILYFLRDVKGINLFGRVVLVDGGKRKILKIQHTYVVN